MASLLAVTTVLRWAAWEAISCCHSAAAVSATGPSTLLGSIGSRHAQVEKRDFMSSTAMRNSAVSGAGAVRGKPPEARNTRALSAPMGSKGSLFRYWKASRSARSRFQSGLDGSGAFPYSGVPRSTTALRAGASAFGVESS